MKVSRPSRGFLSVIVALVALLSISAGAGGPSIFQVRPYREFTISSIFTVAVVLLLAGWVAYRLISYLANIPTPTWRSIPLISFLPLLFLLILSSTSALFNYSVASVQNTVMLALFLLGLLWALNSTQLGNFGLTFVAVSWVPTLLLMTERISDRDLIHNQQAAQVLLLPMLFATVQLMVFGGKKIGEHRWLLLSISGLFIGVASSGARMPTAIALILIAFSSLRVSSKKHKNLARIFANVGLHVAALYVLYSSSDFLTRRLSEVDSQVSHVEVRGVPIQLPNTNGRLRVWEQLLDSMGTSREFFLGRGVGTAVQISKENNFANPHNEFLRYYVDFGLLGLLLFTVFLVGPALAACFDSRVPTQTRYFLMLMSFTITSLSLTNSILLYPDFVLLASVSIGFVLQEYSRGGTELGWCEKMTGRLGSSP